MEGSGGVSGIDAAVEAVSTVFPTPGKISGGMVSKIAETSERKSVGESVIDETISGLTAKAIDDPIKEKLK